MFGDNACLVCARVNLRSEHKKQGVGIGTQEALCNIQGIVHQDAASESTSVSLMPNASFPTKRAKLCDKQRLGQTVRSISNTVNL